MKLWVSMYQGLACVTVIVGKKKIIFFQGDIVLDLAHLVDDTSTAPSKEQILPKLIVKARDLVMMNAINVDLDYAVRGMVHVYQRLGFLSQI